MDPTPEERRRIYEEEKARIEAEEAEQRERWRLYHEEKARLDSEQQTGGPRWGGQRELTLGLDPNLGGLLCYLGLWFTGMIFLLLEQRDKYVRFHAIQSVIVFGTITVTWSILAWIPFVGAFFSFLLGIMTIILWGMLMIKAYQGQVVKVPIAGDIAERSSGI